MGFSALSDHSKGLLLTTIGGLALSVDIPLIRLSSGEAWSILGLRNIVTLSVGIILLLVLRAGGQPWRLLLPGATGLWVGLFYGIGTVTFILAVYYTSAANVVFILAFNPMFAALLAWFVIGERPSNVTIATMLAMLVGVGLIVGDGVGGGHWLGDLLSAISALTTACAITIGRGSKRGMGFMPLLATVIPAAIGLSYALPSGLVVDHPFWILLDGGLMMPLAFWCLATGPRYLSGPEVAMFYLLETILAPVWIWMIFEETPRPMTLIGGSVMMVALASHSLWQARTKGRQAALAG
ncbi:DMT family transporter [Rhizobium tumorigenes]|uniref:DMT family transporter n=1 Tax=Rhizobium tumorigenes TaxID=2041385 RepID=UPI00241CC74A|nr:DMT family transporter [Rhizobium tumorigenes]WFS01910.1 DMT family transporter [Rhizobium tumorigenes]